MKSITKITAEEAKKIYYESQKFKREEIKKGKRVILFNGILVFDFPIHLCPVHDYDDAT